LPGKVLATSPRSIGPPHPAKHAIPITPAVKRVFIIDATPHNRLSASQYPLIPPADSARIIIQPGRGHDAVSCWIPCASLGALCDSLAKNVEHELDQEQQLFGAHLSIAGGLHNALLKAEELKCDTVQLFTKSQKQWAAKPLAPPDIDLFRSHADRLKLKKIVAHDSYLINLAAADSAMWQKSVEAFAIEMQRCDDLFINYLVTHPGAHCGSGDACGVEKVIAALNTLFDRQKDGKVQVLLETTAGQGSCLGCKFEQIAEMIDGIEQKHRVAVCVDTCHILAAGYDITTTDGMKKTLKQMDKTFGLKQIKVWHLNDSKKPLASRVDRHEHIGHGAVGLPAFQLLATDPRFKNTPNILETPKEPEPRNKKTSWDQINLQTLRTLAAGKTPTLKPLSSN
jgi:deoxyribonuclease-4